MIKLSLIDEMKIIAFSDRASAASRVAACQLLYKMNQPPDRIIATLEDIAGAMATPDSARIKAVELLHKIDQDVGTAPVQTAIDEQNVTEQLLEQFCGETE